MPPGINTGVPDGLLTVTVIWKDWPFALMKSVLVAVTHWRVPASWYVTSAAAGREAIKAEAKTNIRDHLQDDVTSILPTVLCTSRGINRNRQLARTASENPGEGEGFATIGLIWRFRM